MLSLGELITVCSDGDVVLASLFYVSEQEDLRLIQICTFIGSKMQQIAMRSK